MYPHSLLWHYLWVAPRLLQLLLLAVILRRKLHHEFPLFTAYTAFQFVLGATLFALDHSSKISAYDYWNAHWGFLIGSILLRFAVIYEIFDHILRPYRSLAALSRRLLRWTAVALLFIAVGVAAAAPADKQFRIVSGVPVVDAAISLMQSGLLVALFLFSSYFCLSWRSRVFGIAAGLGIFSTVDLAAAAIRLAMGPGPGVYALDFVSMATYHCCVIIWLVYFLMREPATQDRLKPLPAHNLEEWNNELERLLQP